ncbi:MAG: monophosphatase [Epulopiscium sp.]|jgi:myo-inositol-1(or 4)-monophosphatase|nr:monophosphatase [Thermoanaerobacterium sp.]MDK2788869.1 monophosphatase [Candidatus Epulonipiscium sp.]MDK2824475.1 monophosphatase [Clostridia bacterium]MDN5322829.1 monophosphatase [Clostridia bacterium]
MNSEPLKFAQKIVLEAGSILRDALCRKVNCDYKNGDHRDLCTEYDLKIENYLISNIQKQFPAHKFVSEERENNDCLEGLVWIIDPIDGTTNFVSWQKCFSISLALYKDSKPLFGLVYDVMQDDLYLGIAGQGAYLNGKKLKRLGKTELKECILDASLNSIQIFYNKHNIKVFNLAKDIRGHRSCGAASLAICKIALGELHIYISAKLRAWDFAAAGIILNEVGGYYNSIFDDCLDLTGKPTVFMACSSKDIYNEIIQSISGENLLCFCSPPIK